MEGGGNIEKEIKNSTVTRIKFGIFVDTWTKAQQQQFDEENRRLNNSENYI